MMLLWFFVFLAVSSESRFCNLTNLSDYTLTRVFSDKEEVWRLTIFVEEAAPTYQIELQEKFIELLLCRLSAAGGVFEVRLYAVKSGKCDKCEFRHIRWNDNKMLQKVKTWFAAFPRYEFAKHEYSTPLDDLLSKVSSGAFTGLTHAVVFRQTPFAFDGRSSWNGTGNSEKINFYAVNFFDEGLEIPRKDRNNGFYEVFFESFEDLRDLSVLLRTEVPQVRDLTTMIISNTNEYDRRLAAEVDRETLLTNLSLPTGHALIPTFDTNENHSMNLIDILVYFISFIVVYMAFMCSYLLGTTQLETIRRFDPLAHINERLRNGF